MLKKLPSDRNHQFRQALSGVKRDLCRPRQFPRLGPAAESRRSELLTPYYGHEIAKLLLAHAGTFLERTEAVKSALELGMPLHEIEDFLEGNYRPAGG